MSDPLIYKVLAVCQFVMWVTFNFRYGRVLLKNGTLRRPVSRVMLTFVGAVLMIGVAMVFYSLATVLRQFFGLDYWGRDAVRITASVLILAAGAVFHLVLSREGGTTRPMRRATDLH